MFLSSVSFLPILMALFGSGQPASHASVTTLTVRNEVIMRVPVIRPRRVPIRWMEKKGPKCIAREELMAAALGPENSIDFLLRDRRRIRARIDDDCPALDFYDGFYLLPEDERVCARRDEIRNRMGTSCRIERFRTMVPKLAK